MIFNVLRTLSQLDLIEPDNVFSCTVTDDYILLTTWWWTHGATIMELKSVTFQQSAYSLRHMLIIMFHQCAISLMAHDGILIIIMMVWSTPALSIRRVIEYSSNQPNTVTPPHTHTPSLFNSIQNLNNQSTDQHYTTLSRVQFLT